MTDTPISSFIHPDDESLLNFIIRKISSDTSNIFVLAEDNFHLDAFFLKFYDALTADEELKVHRMMSPNVEETVGLVNSIGGSMSISEASKERLGLKHILLISDLGPSTAEEWAACESLVSTFPGANINLVAFTSNGGDNAETFKSLGMKSRNTLFELPELKVEMILELVTNASRNDGLGGEINTLLNSRWRNVVREALVAKSGNDGPDSGQITSSKAHEVFSSGQKPKSSESFDNSKNIPVGGSTHHSSNSLPIALIVVLSVAVVLTYYFEIVYEDIEVFGHQAYNLLLRIIKGWATLIK